LRVRQLVIIRTCKLSSKTFTMKVIKYGTKVKTVIGGIKALVTGCCIRNENISYEISYFHNGTNLTVWVQAIEIEIDTVESKPAGLVNYENNTNINLLIE